MSEMRPGVIDILQATICQSPFDWAQDKYHAFIYGIIVGWSDDALKELESQSVLAKEDIERMNVYHGILNRRASWQPIETAPKDHSFILLCDASDGEIYFGRWANANWDIGFDVIPDFTHWQPLPAPPEVTE